MWNFLTPFWGNHDDQAHSQRSSGQVINALRDRVRQLERDIAARDENLERLKASLTARDIDVQQREDAPRMQDDALRYLEGRLEEARYPTTRQVEPELLSVRGFHSDSDERSAQGPDSDPDELSAQGPDRDPDELVAIRNPIAEVQEPETEAQGNTGLRNCGNE